MGPYPSVCNCPITVSHHSLGMTQQDPCIAIVSSIFLPLIPGDTGKLLGIFGSLNAKLLIIHIGYIHDLPFIWIKTISAGGHYPVRLTRLCHYAVKPFCKHTMFIGPHDKFSP